MKKTLSVICILFFIFAFPFNAFAELNTSEVSLKNIADEIIIKSIDCSSENPVTIYSQIEEFINDVHQQLPKEDDLDIARFLMNYTCQSELEVDDSEALKYLNFKEIIVSDEYIKVDETGNSESITKEEATAAVAMENLGIATYNPWTSHNGYMQIKTVASRETEFDKDGYVGYQIAVYGTWLNMPICFFEDVLSLYYSGGTFDNEHEVYGKLEETFNCCGSAKNYKTQVWDNNGTPYYTNKNVYVEFSTDKAVTIRFKLLPASSYQCSRPTSSHSKAVTKILSYMSYGINIKPGDRIQIQGAYGHKRLSAGKIGVSVSGSGINLSSSGGAIIDKYIAAPFAFTAYK